MPQIVARSPSLETGHWPGSFVHDPLLHRPAPPGSLYNFFIRQFVFSPPALNLGLVTYLSGFAEAPLFVLRWSVGVFQKMVILYDFSWNLF